jgi:hypothetical protein
MATSLKTGTWNVNVNGHKSTLEIHSVGADGKLVGTIFGNPIVGACSEAAVRITFLRVFDKNRPESYQSYTGYLLMGPDSTEPGGGHNELAGTFQAFDQVANQGLYGWYAHWEHS